MPDGSVVVIRVNGVDITNKVLYSSARFESQLGAIPGMAEMTVKDPTQTLSFVTGQEWTVDIDGVRMWGGYVQRAVRTFAFPAVDTTTPASVRTRQWKLSGVDYNILFDKRVINNPSNYLEALPNFALNRTMGALIREDLCALYLDLDDDGLDTTTYVDNLYVPRFDVDGNPDPDGTKEGGWPQQGSYWRKAMELFAQFGAVYYIDAEKNLHFHAVEDTVAPWGFSDKPNRLTLPNVAATYGMREVEDVTSNEGMANDAFVWGGSDFAGTGGGTVFARKTNTTSVNTYKRWQYPEVRIGELGDQGLVNARANVIVSGTTTGSSGGDANRGLSVEARQFRLVWFGHDVPLLSGDRAHLRPADLVTISLYVFGSAPETPLVRTLPIRTIRITFPALRSGTGEAFVRFEGFLGVQLDDPWWLWKFLRDSQPPTTGVIATANDSSTSVVYGSFGSFALTPTPNSAATVFAVPFAYIGGTSRVFADGVLQIPGVGYTESDPTVGEVTFTSAVATGVALWMTCRVAGTAS